MLSLKNSTPNNLQAVAEPTTRLIIKTREVEIIIEADTTTEEIIIEEIVAEYIEIPIEKINVEDIFIEEIIEDKNQVVIIVITTTTIITVTTASDKRIN